MPHVAKLKADWIDYFSNDLFLTSEEEYMDAKEEMLHLLDNIFSKTSCTNNTITANWTQFRDLFVSLIHNNVDLCDVERLHYLKMGIVDEPPLLKNLVATGENVAGAWQILLERYENERLLIDFQLSIHFAAHSLKSASSSELKRLIGEIKQSLSEEPSKIPRNNLRQKVGIYGTCQGREEIGGKQDQKVRQKAKDNQQLENLPKRQATTRPHFRD